jgi:hypothetical protein
MLFSNFQKMSLVKAARFFFFPDFVTERLKALGEIDQNFGFNFNRVNPCGEAYVNYAYTFSRN